MKVADSLHRSLRLLDSKGRRRLLLATAAQAASSLLDLAGVFALGIVVAIALAGVSGEPLPQLLVSGASWLGYRQSELQTNLATIALFGALLLIVKSFISLYLARRITRFLANRQAAVSERLITAVLGWPLATIRQYSTQDLAYSLTGGVQLAVTAVLGQAVIASSEIVLLAVLLIGLMAVSPWTTLFTVVYLSAIGLLLHFVVSDIASRVGRDAAKIEIHSRMVIQEGFNAYPELSVLNRRWSFVSTLRSLRWRAAKTTADAQVVGMLPKYIFEIALIVGALVLTAAQLRTRQLPGAMATISVFLLAGSRVVPSIQRLQTAGIVIRQSSAGARETYDLSERLLDTPTQDPSEPTWPTSAIIYSDFVPSVRLENVGFTFEKDATFALREVTFECQPGSSVALVGPSGAGKSTIANLILGLQVPATGDVQVSGVDPRQAVLRWSGAIAYVPQEIAVLDGTIRENVALGIPRPFIDDQLVGDALKQAHLIGFLEEQRDGLDSYVGEGGVRLSGGQKQRLGVARALYSRPRLLVLDEATSALDAETEHLITETLMGLRGKVTTVTIAHRLATIRRADLVVYIADGRIIASGDFEYVRSCVHDFDRQAHLLGL